MFIIIQNPIHKEVMKMGTELIDRRIRKTRKQLKDCLISLLKTKRIQDITVRELTEMADLNRGTFIFIIKMCLIFWNRQKLSSLEN